MWRVTLRGLLAKKFRLVLTSISIVLGVAFMAGTFVLTDTIGGVFDGLFANTTKGVDAVVRSRQPYQASGPGANQGETRPPVPESVVDVVRDVRGVARAEGNLLGYALVIGRDGEALGSQAPTFGLAWYPPRLAINESLELVEGRRARAPDEVTLDVKTFEDSGFRLGDRVRISFLTVPQREFTITGTFLFGGKKEGLAGATLSAFTPDTAQAVMNRVGTWDLVEARADAGVSETTLTTRIRSTLRAEGLAGRYQVLTGEELAKEQADQIQQNLSFFNTFLLIFALVALFVGAFVIYNTFSITVAQRIREIGLLRALGASSKQVNRSVVAEAGVVGVLSALLGIGLGIAIVPALMGLFAAVGAPLPKGGLIVAPRTLIVSFLVGTVITLVSAIAPARRASRVPPIAALRDQAFDPGSVRRRYVWGGVLWSLGAVAIVVALFGGLDSGVGELVGLGAFLAFIGVAMLSPLLARPAAVVLTWPLRSLGRFTARLAKENAERSPRRTASTASALMIGLTLVSAVAVLAASFKTTFAATIRTQSSADFVLSPSNFQPFSPVAAERIRQELPGATVTEYRLGPVQIAGATENVLGASPSLPRLVDMGLRSDARRSAFRDGGLYVRDTEATQRGWKVGTEVPVTFPDGTSTLTVQGIYDKELPPPWDLPIVMSLADWSHFPTQQDVQVGIRVAPGTDLADAARVVKRIARETGGIDADNQAGYIAKQLQQFDQILNLVYVLLLLAVVIALVGIVNTLALSVYERTREIGLLRAVGMTRTQLRQTIRDEALIVSAFGSLLGVVIGVTFAGLVVAALSSDGITFSVPVVQLIVFVVLAVLAGLVAGVPPARRAARLDVLDAITTE